tara:strand:- start:224 stop:550 length:327 start_codon:yes stop_codon:yes gene_type:complete
MSTDEKDAIGENSVVKANVAFMLKTISAVAIATYSFVTIKSDIDDLRNENVRLHHEVDMNSEFRVKWPRGELGSLPDDAEQNMRILFLEKQASKQEELLEELRYGQAR